MTGISDRIRPVRRLAWLAGLAAALFAPRPAAADCPGAANILTNCGFAADLSGWSTSGSGTFGTFAHDATDGSTSPAGSLEGTMGDGGAGSGFLEFFQCVVSPAAATYNFGINMRVVSGSAPTGGCNVVMNSYTNASCTAGQSFLSFVNLAPNGSWQLALKTGVSISSVAAVDLNVTCFGTGGVGTVLRFDNAFLGVGLTPVTLQRFETR